MSGSGPVAGAEISGSRGREGAEISGSPVAGADIFPARGGEDVN
jgi:hypothetical protein